jgi:CheY-like chemotaxis protein
MTAATAETAQPARATPPGRKILVSEDSPITHELLKLLLTQRGHEVDITTNGRDALQALQSKQYDVALLDFHLPEMTGLEVASALRKDTHGLKLPRLIVITADVEGLLANGEDCENFDNIIPKPLDIYRVGELIDEQARIADEEAEATQQPRPLQPRPTASIGGPPPLQKPASFIDALNYEYLSWPDDLRHEHLSARGLQATLGEARFAAIVIREPITERQLTALWRHKALFALPVIDLTGTLGQKADLDGSNLGDNDAERVRELISRFQIRRARLNRDLLFSSSVQEQLLGRVFVSDKPLTATYDVGTKALISYNTTLDGARVDTEAQILSTQGLFKQEFFDRFHVCPRCDSTRLHVREECPKCHSSDLTEEAYLHHFKCAYQGPESEFRSGDSLICPKCRGELSHFGFDYDRPGSMMVCGQCGHASSDPSVGFVCLDCHTHTPGEKCATRDVYSYRITDQGIGVAEYGRSFLATAGDILQFTDLPLQLVVALNAEAKRFNEHQVPFTLVSIVYENERELVIENGAIQFDQARNLFIDNIRSALPDGSMVVKGKSYDFALLSGIAPDVANPELELMGREAQRTVRLDLGARLVGFGPEDIS